LQRRLHADEAVRRWVTRRQFLRQRHHRADAARLSLRGVSLPSPKQGRHDRRSANPHEWRIFSQSFADSLHAYRRELDELDARLISLLAERFAVTRRIGALKAVHGVGAVDRLREQAHLERLVSLSAAVDVPAEVTRAVFETLFRFVRENHRAQAL